MATVLHNFEPGAFVFPSASYASPDVIQATLPKPAVRFQKGQMAYVMIEAIDYGSGNLTVDVWWCAVAATSGDVMWGAAIGAITPNVDSTEPTGKTLGTAATVVDSHLGTTAGRIHQATITVSSLDSLAAGDHLILEITRENDASDNIGEDILLLRVSLSYSNT